MGPLLLLPVPVRVRVPAAASQARHLEPAGGAAVGRHVQLLLLCAGGRVQVDVEGEDVGREDEGDDPLEHGAGVVVAREGAGDEGDGEQDLDDDEGELDVEGEAEDALLAMAFFFFFFFLVRVSMETVA